MQQLITPALHAVAEGIRLLDKTDEKGLFTFQVKELGSHEDNLDTTITLLSEFPQWGVENGKKKLTKSTHGHPSCPELQVPEEQAT